MHKIILASLCFGFTLHGMQEPITTIVINFAQKDQISDLIAFNKNIINSFFKPLLLTKHPDNPFVNKMSLLDKFLDNLDTGFVRHLYNAIDDIEGNNAHVTVASRNNDLSDILGICAFTKKEDCIYINFIAVAEHARRHGIGKALLNNVLSTCKEIKSCKLKTFAYDNESVQSFYENFGFVKQGLATLIEGAPNTHIMYQLDIQKLI